MEKTQYLTLRNIFVFKFYNRYIYSKTKIERILLRLHKRVLSIACVCKTVTATHASVALVRRPLYLLLNYDNIFF
jgi:hypothetical protein